MSIRNDIAVNIIKVLKDASDPRFVFVSRAPFDPQQLSNAQFPCAYVESLNETRQDETMSSQTRTARMIVTITAFVRTSPEQMDETRNNVIERVEESLDADRTRGGVAVETQLINVSVENDVEATIGKIVMETEVLYKYKTGVV